MVKVSTLSPQVIWFFDKNVITSRGILPSLPLKTQKKLKTKRQQLWRRLLTNPTQGRHARTVLILTAKKMPKKSKTIKSRDKKSAVEDQKWSVLLLLIKTKRLKRSKTRRLRKGRRKKEKPLSTVLQNLNGNGEIGAQKLPRRTKMTTRNPKKRWRHLILPKTYVIRTNLTLPLHRTKRAIIENLLLVFAMTKKAARTTLLMTPKMLASTQAPVSTTKETVLTTEVFVNKKIGHSFWHRSQRLRSC